MISGTAVRATAASGRFGELPLNLCAACLACTMDGFSTVFGGQIRQHPSHPTSLRMPNRLIGLCQGIQLDLHRRGRSKHATTSR